MYLQNYTIQIDKSSSKFKHIKTVQWHIYCCCHRYPDVQINTWGIVRSSPKHHNQNHHLKTTALDTKVSESLSFFLWSEFKKEIFYNSQTDAFIYVEVLMFELGCICLRSMFVPIPHLSFEGHKVPRKILELGLGFLIADKEYNTP